MNWYKIKVDLGTESYIYAGSSPDSPEELAQKALRGEYIRLENLVYNERGEIKDWAEWDEREMPEVLINPAKIIAIQQFKDDPRSLPKSHKQPTTSLRREDRK